MKTRHKAVSLSHQRYCTSFKKDICAENEEEWLYTIEDVASSIFGTWLVWTSVREDDMSQGWQLGFQLEQGVGGNTV